MIDEKVEEALEWCRTYGNSYALTIAAAYIEKCEEYNRLLEVAEEMATDLELEACNSVGLNLFKELAK